MATEQAESGAAGFQFQFTKEGEVPVLETPHLFGYILGPWHADDIIAIWNDKSTSRWMADPEGEPCNHEEYLENHSTHPSEVTDGRSFIFYTKEDRVPAAFSAFYDFDTSNSSAETSFCVVPSFRGRGFGTEVNGAAICYAFESTHFQCHSLFSTVVTENAPSVACTERCGYKKIGIRRETHRLEGRWYNEWLFDMLAGDWLAAKAAHPALSGIRILHDI
ncbi:hypothetical protein PAPYR_1739 [Paratrimastix pyriformis]|uniref:N-acetyltransferase domain-containing protein n=1 Tax=Paratrimastix pyriformis TaxID=342808 RepID=A0ABQ8UV68_9EUKA|nr:hypothetical protein PAPYR_1739 [Paratrimastix pyriformis]